MTWVSGIVVYLLIWWTVIFCILPLGLRPTPGNESIPINPKLLQKALLTTLVSGILWGVVYELIEHRVISFYDMAEELAIQDQQQEMQQNIKSEPKK